MRYHEYRQRIGSLATTRRSPKPTRFPATRRSPLNESQSLPMGIALAACSSGTATNQTASPSVPATASASASPTATAVTPAVAYMRAVCPLYTEKKSYQAVAKKFNDGDASITQMRAAAAAMAAAERTQAASLDSPSQPWPANVEKEIGTVVDSSLADFDYYQNIAAAKTRVGNISAANADVRTRARRRKSGCASVCHPQTQRTAAADRTSILG